MGNEITLQFESRGAKMQTAMPFDVNQLPQQQQQEVGGSDSLEISSSFKFRKVSHGVVCV